jgi:hypothetical protein
MKKMAGIFDTFDLIVELLKMTKVANSEHSRHGKNQFFFSKQMAKTTHTRLY